MASFQETLEESVRMYDYLNNARFIIVSPQQQ